MLPEKFMKVLWGDYYYNRDTRKFMREPLGPFTKRAFVEFILEPMYKIIAHTISHEKDELLPILKQLGVYLKAEDFRLSVRQLLKKVCSLFFGPSTCFVDMLEKWIPTPAQAASYYVDKFYTGVKYDKTSELVQNMYRLNPEGPCILNALKLYNSTDCKTFYTLCKVMAGTVKKGDQLKILGERYSPEDPEDMSIKVATNLYLHQSRYYVPVKEAYPGNWVLIEGIDQAITKTATIVDAGYDQDDLRIFRPIRFTSPSFFKLAIEPLIPSDLPKMLEGLRKISKSYPACQTKIEESGEHLIIGSGELYLDSIMHDLRLMYSEVEIKVSDPSVTFCETVMDTSSIKCTSTTPNKMNKMTMIAEPIDKGLDLQIELEHIDLDWSKDRISNFFQKEYSWDLLQSQSVWAFGPDTFGPNVLIDDSLPGETDKRALGDLKDSFVQGFQWSCREGPLCEEPVRGVKFKIMNAEIAREPLMRIPGQIIPTARRTCYSSFLMANPRILEPQLVTEIQCTGDCLPAVYNVLNRRRGHLIQELAKPGSPLFTVKASVPALDSFGFETDLRSHTVGSAFNLSFFDSWTILPGDPLDRSIQLKVLEPSPPSHLAREVLVKLRKRKGLNEEVSVLNYFDDPNIIELLRRDDDYRKVI
jgi:U5 small nuclear ribonucleoprotein component